MFNIFISCIVGSIIIIGNAYIFNFLFFKKKINEFNIFKDSILGFILIGFIGLLINFFFPINKLISSIFLVISLIIFFYFFYKFKKKNELVYILIFLTLTTFITITYANINRPDAGLYHLPYIKLLNEDKIIIGLSNLHFRFGHTSIFQYISALYVNFFFIEEFLNIPLAILPSLYFLFLFKNYTEALQKKNEKDIITIFLISIFSLYSFNRFSSLGNDGPASIFFLVLVINYLQIQNIKFLKSNDFYLISITSVFLLTLKPTMIFVLLFPFLFFLINKNKINLIKDIKFIFCVIFIILWTFKNVIISGCIIFPIKQTCLNNLIYSNIEIAKSSAIESEAWAKGYPDSKVKNGYEEYNKKFNWIKTWFDNHLNIILEKVSPLLILIFLIISIYIYQFKTLNKFKLNNIILDKKYLYLNFFLFFYLIIWFLSFHCIVLD